MPRNISNTLRDAVLAQATSEGIIPLVTITWNDGVYSGTIRLCLHDEDITSNGNLYSAGSFEITLPDEDDTEIPKMRIVFDDVDLTIRRELRKLSKPASITLQLVLLTNVDSVEMSVTGKLRVIDLSEPVVSGEIRLHDDLATAPYPAYRFSRGFGYQALR